MNPIRKRRLWLIAALVVAAGIATALVALALQRNVAYLYTPSEILGGSAGDAVRSGQARFRLGGMVAADSFARAARKSAARNWRAISMRGATKSHSSTTANTA